MKLVNPELRNSLLRAIKKSDTAMTARQLYDVPEVQALFASTFAISNYLGFLYRRKDLRRETTGETGSKARWAYRVAPHIVDDVSSDKRVILNRRGVCIEENNEAVYICADNVQLVLRFKPR